jgi:hypothetical protein
LTTRERRTQRLLVPILGLVALIAALTIPASASAADPATDQYAPTVPGGGGSVPASDSGLSGTGSGNGGGDQAPADDAGATGETGSSTAPAATATEETPAGVAAPGANDDSSAAGGSHGQKADDGATRTLDGFAQAAESQRQAQAAAGTGDIAHSDGGGDGMGVFLWIVLGLTLAWAIGFGVTRHRQTGQPA